MRAATLPRIHAGITAFTAPTAGGADLSALSDEELTVLAETTTAAFDALLDEHGQAPSPEQLQEMQATRDELVRIRGERAAREAASAERQAQAVAFREEIHGPTETEETPETEEVAETVPAAVTAAGGRGTPRPPLARVTERQPRRSARPTVNTPGRATLTAAAGLGEWGAGDTIDFADAAKIWDKRRSAFPKYGTPGRTVVPVMSIHMPTEPALVASGEYADQAMANAVDFSRLPNGDLIESMTAAGTGWCAPSQVMYNVEGDGASVAGVINVPEVTVERGGMKWIRGVDFAALYSGTGFDLTEAQNLSGVQKTINEVPCPSPFLEKRLDTVGYAVKSGILQRQGFPETVEQFLAGVAIAHEHRVSAKTIQLMLADSTNMGTYTTTPATAAIALLEVIDLQATDFRARHAVDDDTVLECVLPYWIKGVLRADYSKRNGVDLPMEVTDAQIVNWFTIRKIAVQFTIDWQTLLTQAVGADTGADAVRIGNDPTVTPIVAWPNKVQVLLYKAGTFVRGREDVISINGLYDLSLLADNKELAVFTEQGILVARKGFDARKFTVTLLPSGTSAAQTAFTTQL